MAIDAQELRADEPQWTQGDRFRKAREYARLEQSDLADQLGVSRAVISKWERGSQPRNFMTTVRRWSEATGVSVQWLLGLSTSGYMHDSASGYMHDSPLTLVPAMAE